jgi:hypothetical protein
MNEEEIKDFINSYGFKPAGMIKLYPMLCEMVDYIMVQKPTSKFYRLCAHSIS